VVIAEADADALAVDELGSDVSVDEDAVPARKVTANNTEWPEHLIIQSKTVLDVDPNDGELSLFATS
jgi:rRNA-processing protein EBP2